MWGLGVPQVNAYKIYQYMWDEEKAKERRDLPEKWSHAEFIEQLVYDLIFPEQTVVHQEALQEEEDDLSVSRRSLSSVSGTSLQEEEDREWNFSCNSGINQFLARDKGRRITKEKMNGSHFSRRLMGISMQSLRPCQPVNASVAILCGIMSMTRSRRNH
jgi:hypothetical protein